MTSQSGVVVFGDNLSVRYVTPCFLLIFNAAKLWHALEVES